MQSGRRMRRYLTKAVANSNGVVPVSMDTNRTCRLQGISIFSLSLLQPSRPGQTLAQADPLDVLLAKDLEPITRFYNTCPRVSLLASVRVPVCNVVDGYRRSAPSESRMHKSPTLSSSIPH
eukprot:evm.model.scf_1291.2 EVM.evm.TU.scf_1291.2   scf_1291:15560-16340(+)